ncbi:type VI secretion system lipoprotein TssJ [Pseudomonas sp. F1_0610]|uniref:type VI secretion system lipoprotein TssJ n=1 Tax=Pseudomonas sp. F1_0610 TaxID=3114284 RepID=UPI0039C34B43
MNMATIAGNYSKVFLLCSFLLASGCMTQTKTLHLDINARDSLNNNASGSALSTVVRIYQLKDRQAFDNLDYDTLAKNDNHAVKADLVSQKDFRVRPSEALAVDMPIDKKVKFIAIAALFLNPDLEKDSWRIVIPRRELSRWKARKIELNNQEIILQPK